MSGLAQGVDGLEHSPLVRGRRLDVVICRGGGQTDERTHGRKGGRGGKGNDAGRRQRACSPTSRISGGRAASPAAATLDTRGPSSLPLRATPQMREGRSRIAPRLGPTAPAAPRARARLECEPQRRFHLHTGRAKPVPPQGTRAFRAPPSREAAWGLAARVWGREGGPPQRRRRARSWPPR